MNMHQRTWGTILSWNREAPVRPYDAGTAGLGGSTTMRPRKCWTSWSGMGTLTSRGQAEPGDQRTSMTDGKTSSPPFATTQPHADS